MTDKKQVKIDSSNRTLLVNYVRAPSPAKESGSNATSLRLLQEVHHGIKKLSSALLRLAQTMCLSHSRGYGFVATTLSVGAKRSARGTTNRAP